MVILEDVFAAYQHCLKNKRGTENALEFELNFERNCIELCTQINDRTYRPRKSIAFIVTKPRLREIFAASFRDRVIHHFLDINLRPLLEKEFIDTTCNNRKGKGTAACINYLKKDIQEESENYTKDCWVAKMDMKGFFMSIKKGLLTDLILKFIEEKYTGADKEDIKWLTTMTVNDHPEKHCVLRSPQYMWKKLDHGKSLFWVGDLCGIPIGNLISQLLANFYLNDFDHYVIDTLGLSRYGRYVDDFYIVSNDKQKILSNIPSMRDKLSERGITLHPHKFYIQHYSKGIELVGAVVKPGRTYVHDRTICNMQDCIREYNGMEVTRGNSERLVSVINSYLGFMAAHDTYKIRRDMVDKIDDKWWAMAYVDSHYKKIVLREEFRMNVLTKDKILQDQLINKRNQNGKATSTN